MQSIRSALRHAAVHPARSLTLVVVMALVAGAAGAILRIHAAIAWMPLPYPAAERLFTASAGARSWSPAMFEAFSETNTVFESLAGIAERGVVLTGHGAARVLRAEGVSPAYFELFGAPPVYGGAWRREDDREEAAVPAVVSHRLAVDLFGAPERALGQRVIVEGAPITINGVTAAAFHGLVGRTDLWIPLRQSRTLGTTPSPARPWSRWFEVVGRVREGMTPELAAATFGDQARRALGALPGAEQALGRSWKPALRPLRDQLGSPALAKTMRLLAGAVGLVLLLACANLAALQVLSALQRRHEFTVKAAIGCTPRRLVADLLAESAVLAGASAGLSGLVAYATLILVERALDAPAGTFGLQSAARLGMPASPDSFLSVATLLGPAAVVGLSLALPMVGAAVATMGRPLQKESDGRRWLSARRVAGALVAAEIAVALAVVVAAGLMSLTARTLWQQDRGFDPAGVLTMELQLPQGTDGDRLRQLHADVIERVNALPGVEAASLSNCAPGTGRCRQTNVGRVDGVPFEAQGAPTVGVHYVTDGHLDVLRARLVRGRGFRPSDAGGPPVVIVNESAAARLWPGQDPLGRRLGLFFASGANVQEREVVGVVRDIRFNVLERDPRPDVYAPASQFAWSSTVLFVRAGRAVGQLQIRSAVHEASAGIAVVDGMTLESRIGRGFASERLLSAVLNTFGVVAVLLIASGVYAIVAHAVAVSRREIAIRVAIGASRARMIRWVAGRAAWLAASGLAAGGLAAAWTATLLRSTVVGVSPHDPFVWGVAIAGILVVAAGAVAVPVRRALAIDPAAIMRD